MTAFSILPRSKSGLSSQAPLVAWLLLAGCDGLALRSVPISAGAGLHADPEQEGRSLAALAIAA